MQQSRVFRLEGLEVRTMLAADLSIPVTPDPAAGCNAVDAGYLSHGFARPNFGDANCDGVFNSADIVQIMQAGEYEDNQAIFDPPGDRDAEFKGIRNAGNSTWEEGDFDGDGDATSHDLVFALQYNPYSNGSSDTGSRSPWDVNNDGVYNSSDLVRVMTAGEYEDNEAVYAEDGEFKGNRNVRNSSAVEGDWNGDLEFTSADLVLSMQAGEYSG